MVTRPPSAQPFSLEQVFADPVTLEVFSERNTVRLWLAVEAALAEAEAEVGLIPVESASRIAAAAHALEPDLEALWLGMRTVGYPILPTVQALCSAVSPQDAAWVHFGATTQDIMDTALALQMKEVLSRLRELLSAFGDALASLASRHSTSVMAARTHALQAVPTTLAAKLAVYLDDTMALLTTIDHIEPDVCRVSLFGAGGTGAGIGPSATAVRQALAHRLGLAPADVPWHSSRRGVAQFGFACALVAQLSGRMASEVINLGRTEVSEVTERGGHLRGASSTMPQKANPILSETAVGASLAVGTLLPALHGAAQPSHERAAGEWHAEWYVVPAIARHATTGLFLMVDVLNGLSVDDARMRGNLHLDGGLILAEAYMFALAEDIGRDEAHRVMYDVAQRARANGSSLTAEIEASLPDLVSRLRERGEFPLRAEDYTGEAADISRSVVDRWAALRAGGRA